MPTIGGLTCTVFDHGGKMNPAKKQVERFAHPMRPGFGTISGPKRQSSLVATTYHPVADATAAATLVAAAYALIDTFVSLNTGILTATDVKVEDCECTSKAVAGLPGSSTWLVVISWQLLLPIDW